MDTFKRKIPLLVTITLIFGFIISFIVGLVNYIKLLYYAFEPPSQTIEVTYVPLVLMFFSLVLGELSFRFYSRIPNLHVKNGKLILLIASHIAVDVQFLWFATAPIHAKVIPYLSEKAAHVNFGEYKAIGEVLAGNFHTLTLIFVFLPTVFMLLYTLWYSGHIVRYRNEIFDWMKKYEYKNQRLQKWFNGQEEQIYPDVEIGPHIEHKEMVRIKGKDRTLNGIIVGPIGSGKTSSLIIPMINQDLHWMVRFINQFEKAYEQKNYHTEEVKGTFLNGVTVIEPSNDLCQKVYKLVQAHRIPESSVYYIDPTNPDTKNINILRGPVDKVAEVFAMVIQGLSESNNAFFEQAQRNHLKQHIYLLKLHNPQKDVTFDDLIEMYDDVERVHRMHVLLKVQVEKLHDFVQSRAATRDQTNEYKIIKGIDEWFDNTIREKMDRDGEPAVYKSGKYRGKPMHYDREEEYVKGLRNILKDLASNVLIRRVLFGKSDFDFDVHLEQGGILLVNTAKGELADLSNVLGKFVLLSMQNAVFRREPNVSPYHHLVIDEFPDYVVRPFKEFPAQSRKYKLILTIASQTLSQLALDFTEQYMFTLLGSFRNKMIFGDVTPYDAKIFSDMFGEKEEFKESESEQGISPMQENPVSRLGSTYQKSKEVVMSPGDIMAQGAFICAARIVQDNHVQPVQQITSNFVPKEEFSKSIIQVGDNTGQYWENERTRLIGEAIEKANPMKHVDAENMKRIEPLPPVENEDNESDTPIENDEQQIVSLEAFKDHKVVEDKENNPRKSIPAFEPEQDESLEKDRIAEELYHDAEAFVIDKQQASSSLLQRKYRIGYARAARLIEKLEQNLVISPYTGGAPRKVLIPKENSNGLLQEEGNISSIQNTEDESLKGTTLNISTIPYEDNMSAPEEHTEEKSLKETNLNKNAIPSEDNVSALEENSFKDILYDDAVTYVRESQNTSASSLKDKFNINDIRANRLIDALERDGILEEIKGNCKVPDEPLFTEVATTVEVTELPDIDVTELESVDINTLNEDLAFSISQQDWNAATLEQEPFSVVEEHHEEIAMDVYIHEVEGNEQQQLQEELTTKQPTNTVQPENKLEPEVAEVYKSISNTIQKNLEQSLPEKHEHEEERDFNRMTPAERRKYIREQQRKMLPRGSNIIKENPSQNKTSNVSHPDFDSIFGEIEK